MNRRVPWGMNRNGYMFVSDHEWTHLEYQKQINNFKLGLGWRILDIGTIQPDIR